ncbi:MAG: penicillin acylase family protein, partial [Pseudomonadota bacterium]
MATLFRWLLRLFTGAFILGAGAVFLLYWFATRSIPDYQATLEVDGLTAPVEIVRDNANVPHIFGDSDRDVYFGLGLAHAQDRLWQMMMLRRTAQGRLSEMFGPRTFAIDDLLRRLDLYPLAVQSVRVQSPYAQEALAAYAAGVNAWLAEINAGARGRGAPEYWIFPPQIAPWQPADSVAIAKIMALQLSGQIDSEVLRARVSLLMDDDRVRDILPDAPGSGVAALPEFASLFPTAPRYAAVTRDYDPLSPVKPRGLSGASNAWAAAPTRSAAGGTLMANDPHLGFSAPGTWYLARLQLETGGVIGGTIPGLPLVVLGRSERLGWALTYTHADDQDVFIERLNPDNPEEVLTPNGYRPLTTRRSIIRVDGEEPRTITLRWSDNGPILPGSQYGLAAITPPGHVASVSWTALSGADTSVTAAFDLMRAGSVDEAIEVAERFIAPAQNLTLVDRETIALKTIGALPRRAARHQTQGRMPSPGWQSENRWQGRLSYAANPEFRAPEGGILGNTNNKLADKPFPFHVTHDWGDTQRVQRWQRLMQNREVHTRESFIEAQ